MKVKDEKPLSFPHWLVSFHRSISSKQGHSRCLYLHLCLQCPACGAGEVQKVVCLHFAGTRRRTKISLCKLSASTKIDCLHFASTRRQMKPSPSKLTAAPMPDDTNRNPTCSADCHTCSSICIVNTDVLDRKKTHPTICSLLLHTTFLPGHSQNHR
jgi:hypothetical protein